MELLVPSPPPSPGPAVDRYGDGASSSRVSFHCGSSGEGRIFVAVGRSPEKTLALLRWVFRRFDCKEIGLLHVHQPSPVIPTLLGKIPVNQANDKLVSLYRNLERETTVKIMQSYQRYCQRAQVQASIFLTETEQIQNGIVNLVTQHGIRKLIMGSTPENRFKLKGITGKAAFTAKNAPAFCEIWFVSKGRHIWTREASEVADSFVSSFLPEESVSGRKFQLMQHNDNYDTILYPLYATANSFLGYNLQANRLNDQTEPSNLEILPSPFNRSAAYAASLPDFHGSLSSPDAVPCLDLSPNFGVFQEVNAKDELDPEFVSDRLRALTVEVEKLKKEAFAELVKRKQTESAVADAFDIAKAFEVARQHEIETMEELEDLLKATKLQHIELVQKKDEVFRELKCTLETIASLESQAQELAFCRDECARELELTKASIGILKLQRQTYNEKADQNTDHLMESASYALSPNHSWVVGLGGSSNMFSEFSLSDLQTATCDFSESFKLGEGGYGFVYKGEIMGRTVMIKKLHTDIVRGQIEFQQEVHVLSKLRHPHLVTLLGMCPEALSLVHEYMTNGTLQDCLFNRTTSKPLSWRVRSRIVAQMSSALLFLHSSKPEKIIHGNMKPENIFLDENFNCKIGNLGFSILLQENGFHNLFFSPSIEPQGSFPYSDPEYQKTRKLTPKSDVYALGIIVLQLLTGRSPSRVLVSEMRKALLSGNLASILDPRAGDWPSDVSRSLAKFACECSQLNSRDRPDLTPEVVKDLKQLYTRQERSAPSFFLCPILQEIMHDPHVAADGFTYEGRAIRDWLENGRDTSPMTNLKLKHLILTPNHALRVAIQDWLCQS